MRSQTNFLPAGIAPPPAKPQFALEVAVVGNRVIGPRAAQVEAVVASIWDTLSNQLKYVLNQEFDLPVIGDAHHGHKEEQTLAHRRHVNEFFDTTRQPLLTLMSALAKGVDQIAASTFLKRKAIRQVRAHDIDMELDSIMPFRLADYPGLPGQLRRSSIPRKPSSCWKSNRPKLAKLFAWMETTRTSADV